MLLLSFNKVDGWTRNFYPNAQSFC